MPDDVSESLSLDITEALAGIQQISDALDQVVQQFQVGLAQALETLTAIGSDVTPLADSLDVAGLGTAIDTALSEASTPVPIDGDTSGLESALADALDAPRDVPIDADVSGLAAGIDEVTGTPQTVSVDADITAAKDAVDSLDNEPITLSAEVDVSGAQDQIDQLTQSVTGLGGAGSHGGEELAGLEGAVLGIKAATGAASGEVGGLTEGVGALGSGAAVAAGGVVALGGFIGETAKLAADAQAQNKRFADTFGDLAARVREIDVGGLNTDLETLGKTSGTTAADLEATASRIGLLGQSSGASNETIVSTTQNLLALGATISVNNPRLGDAASVTDRLTNAFARGGRALAPFGLALSSAQINAEALRQTGKATAADLTLFEKSTAGASLALATFGDTLGTKFADGAQNAQVQFRALKTQLEETLVAIGGPLLAPLTASLTDLLPVAEQVGIVLGKLAEVVLPLVAALAPALVPLADALGLVGDGLGVIADVPTPALLAIAAGITAIAVSVAGLDVAAGVAAAALDTILAINPVIAGLAVGLAALGLAANLFGGEAETAKIDTNELAGAFAAASSSGTDFSNTFGDLNKSIDAYLQKQLLVGESGKTGFDAAVRLGLSIEQIRTAITGSSESYAQFLRNIQNVTGGTKDQKAANDALENSIRAAGNALNSQAAVTLATAVQQGVLKEAQLKSVEASHTAKDGNIDYIDSLRDLTPAIDAATVAANKQAETLSTTSPVFADLAQNFAQGKITIDSLTSSLTDFGFAGDGAATEAKKISDALTTLLKSEDALPQVGSVMDDFAATVKKDFQQVADDVSKGTGDVQADLAKLANDSDPQRFAENLNTQTANIVSFTNNLRLLVAEGFGGLAASLAEKGPEVAGALAASLSSDRAAAVSAAGAEKFAAASRQQLDTFLRAHFPELAQLGEEQGSAIAGGAVAGINAGTGAVNTAVEGIGAGAASHFKPDFTGAVDAATKAAATALAADPTVSQAAGEKALQVVQSFAGLLTPDEAVRVALGQARDAIAADPTLAVAASGKGKEISDAFGTKTDIKGAAAKAFADAAALIPGLSNVPNVAGILGVEAGEAFGQGLANGIDQRGPAVVASATAIANAAAAAVRKAHVTASPSRVAFALGQQFTQGLALGLVDGEDDTAAAAKRVADDLVAKLQKELADGIAKVAAQASATSALNAFASGATARLPTIGGDISSFFSQLTQAQNAEAQAMDDYHKAYAQLADDTERLHKLRAADSNFQQQLLAAKQTVANAQNKLDADTAKKNDAALAQDRTNLDAAQSRLKALQDRLAGVRDQVRGDQEAIAGAAKDLNAAQKALATATNPDTFIKNLNQQTAASKRFLADLAVLKNEGFTDLANELAQAGPDAAGRLADAFAGNAGKAKQAEAAIDAADAFAKAYTKRLEDLFGGSTVAKVAAAAGQNIGGALNDGIQDVIKFDPSASNKLTVPSLAAPLQRVPSLTSVQGVQTLALNLTIDTDDGRTLHASIDIPVPPPGPSLVQQTTARVKAL